MSSQRRRIVVLTGAGISRESGIDTFRDAGGIWSEVKLEDVATPRAFARNPALVHQFYNARRRQLLSGQVEPNDAHRALADLEHGEANQVTIITQNIDDLHERAGSVNVIHMHGELLKARCHRCGVVVPCRTDLNAELLCPHCSAAGVMRSHVVWFGEMPLSQDRIRAAIKDAGLFLSIGTSGTVYPAAGLVEDARRAGARTVELNLERSANAAVFDEGIYGPATRVVREYVNALLSRPG